MEAMMKSAIEIENVENQFMAAIELLRTISSTSAAKDAAVDVYFERLG
jgi:hypothetical protein